MSELRVKGARHLGRAVGPANLVVYPLVTVLVGLGSDLPRAHPYWLVATIVSTFLLGIPRWLLGRRLLTATPRELPQVMRSYIISSFLVAGAWSFFSCKVILAYPGEWTSLLVAMVAAGITAGSTSGLNPNLLLQLGFIYIMMLPPAVAMAFSGGSEEVWASLNLVLYALFVSRTGLNNHRQFVSLLVANRDLAAARDHEKLQRQQICQLEERWSYAFQGSGSGVWDYNPQTQRMYFSPRLREMLRLPADREEFSLDDWFQRVVGEDVSALRLALQRNLDGSSDCLSCENRLIQADGAPCWTMARGKVVERDSEGRPLRMVGTCTDIEDQKQLQIQLNLSRNLESVGQLAAGIAHEINTPLQYINDNVSFLEDSFAELMEEGGKPDDLEFLRLEIPAALKQTARGLSHVSKIVSAMREFTHSGRGERQAVDLNHLVETTLTICRARLREVKDVHTELAADLPPVPAVQSELSQVVLNLLVNAADAISDRQRSEPDVPGQIVVTTRLQEEKVEITIQDNGCGIKSHQEQKIFEPFFTTKEVGRGTGQGLALCRNIVRGHGGDIRFSSQAGKGTTFAVQFPLKPTA